MEINRAKKRANAQAEAYLDSLMELYTGFKNQHSHSSLGHAVVDKVVSEYRKELDLVWKCYCERNNNSSKRVINLRPEAFKERVDGALRNHNRLSWFVAVRDLCREKYGFEPPQHLIFETFGQFSDVNDAAIHCLNFISPFSNNHGFSFSPKDF